MNKFLPLFEDTKVSKGPSPSQPEIAYQPDEAKFKARTKRRLESDLLSKKLPKGFPATLDSPLAWKGSDFHDEEWVTVLNANDVEEIKKAVEHFKGI